MSHNLKDKLIRQVCVYLNKSCSSFDLVFDTPNSLQYISEGEIMKADALECKINETITMKIEFELIQNKLLVLKPQIIFPRWEGQIVEINNENITRSNKSLFPCFELTKSKRLSESKFSDIEKIIHRLISSQFDSYFIKPKLQVILPEKVLAQYQLLNGIFQYLDSNNLINPDGSIQNKLLLSEFILSDSSSVNQRAFFLYVKRQTTSFSYKRIF